MITGINHLTWNVKNIDVAFDFYVNILGLKPIMKSNKSAYFLAVNVWLAVTKGEKCLDRRYDHIAFDLDKKTFDSLVEKLKQNNVSEWKENNSEGESFYFLDPFGNKFELHYSNLESRIKYGKENWGHDIEWYV